MIQLIEHLLIFVRFDFPDFFARILFQLAEQATTAQKCFMLLLKGRDEASWRDACEAVIAAARRIPRAVVVGLDARPVSML